MAVENASTYELLISSQQFEDITEVRKQLGINSKQWLKEVLFMCLADEVEQSRDIISSEVVFRKARDPTEQLRVEDAKPSKRLRLSLKPEEAVDLTKCAIYVGATTADQLQYKSTKAGITYTGTISNVSGQIELCPTPPLTALLRRCVAQVLYKKKVVPINEEAQLQTQNVGLSNGYRRLSNIPPTAARKRKASRDRSHTADLTQDENHTRKQQKTVTYQELSEAGKVRRRRAVKSEILKQLKRLDDDPKALGELFSVSTLGSMVLESHSGAALTAIQDSVLEGFVAGIRTSELAMDGLTHRVYTNIYNIGRLREILPSPSKRLESRRKLMQSWPELQLSYTDYTLSGVDLDPSVLICKIVQTLYPMALQPEHLSTPLHICLRGDARPVHARLGGVSEQTAFGFTVMNREHGAKPQNELHCFKTCIWSGKDTEANFIRHLNRLRDFVSTVQTCGDMMKIIYTNEDADIISVMKPVKFSLAADLATIRQLFPMRRPQLSAATLTSVSAPSSGKTMTHNNSIDEEILEAQLDHGDPDTCVNIVDKYGSKICMYCDYNNISDDPNAIPRIRELDERIGEIFSLPRGDIHICLFHADKRVCENTLDRILIDFFNQLDLPTQQRNISEELWMQRKLQFEHMMTSCAVGGFSWKIPMETTRRPKPIKLDGPQVDRLLVFITKAMDSLHNVMDLEKREELCGMFLDTQDKTLKLLEFMAKRMNAVRSLRRKSTMPSPDDIDHIRHLCDMEWEFFISRFLRRQITFYRHYAKWHLADTISRLAEANVHLGDFAQQGWEKLNARDRSFHRQHSTYNAVVGRKSGFETRMELLTNMKRDFNDARIDAAQATVQVDPDGGGNIGALHSPPPSFLQTLPKPWGKQGLDKEKSSLGWWLIHIRRKAREGMLTAEQLYRLTKLELLTANDIRIAASTAMLQTEKQQRIMQRTHQLREQRYTQCCEALKIYTEFKNTVVNLKGERLKSAVKTHLSMSTSQSKVVEVKARAVDECERLCNIAQVALQNMSNDRNWIHENTPTFSCNFMVQLLRSQSLRILTMFENGRTLSFQ